MKSLGIKLGTVLSLLLGSVVAAEAQFYSIGNDPARTEWSQITTDSYRLVFPKGYDSLAFVYAGWLEKVKKPISGSLGFVPNQNYKKKMPVILHPFTSVSNGMVTWTPRRMELYTTPDHYDPIPLDWPMELSIHESRHVAQMQPAAGGALGKVGGILSGELIAGAMSSVFGGPAAMEGDAVLAETALTASGRGRNADFLEYQRACFAEGDFRDYWKWRFGSQKEYTPSHYTIGYISHAGMRYFSDFSKWPYSSIGSRLEKTFPVIADSLATMWENESRARGPFPATEKITMQERHFVEYSSPAGEEGRLFAVRSGISEDPQLVRINEGGDFERLVHIASISSRIRYSSSDGKLYWSENRPDIRWELKSSSVIRVFDTTSGESEYLTRGTRYFNPSPSPDGRYVCASEALEDGTSAVVILSSSDGTPVRTFPLPPGFQAVETAWIGNRIYLSAISQEGIGIYELDGFNTVLKASPAKIKGLGSHEGKLTFISDRDGVDEVYSLDPADGNLLEITRSRQGTNDYLFVPEVIYTTSLSSKGRMLHRIRTDSLIVREAGDAGLHKDRIAEALSSAEPFRIDSCQNVEISSPERYSRLSHSIKFHSWVPVYFDYNIIDNLSFDAFMVYSGLGATAFFQNDLSNLSGAISYSAWTPAHGWRNGGHVKLTYSGLFPVFELSADISDSRAAYIQYSLTDKNEMEHNISLIDNPSANLDIKAYVPLNLSSGGWSRGIIPQINGTFTNNMASFGSQKAWVHNLSLSIRGYSMLSVPSSNIYPKWGIGAESGFATRPGLGELYTSNLYGYMYGYLPGLAKTHGIRLSSIIETHSGNGILVFPYANTAPRGASYVKTEMARYPLHGKFTIDYAMPFAPVDWSFLEPLAYVRNFELIAHYDYSFFRASKDKGSLSSVGADLCVKLGNILWIPYTTRIGISYSYNYGDLVERPHHIGLVFSMDI